MADENYRDAVRESAKLEIQKKQPEARETLDALFQLEIVRAEFDALADGIQKQSPEIKKKAQDEIVHALDEFLRDYRPLETGKEALKIKTVRKLKEIEASLKLEGHFSENWKDVLAKKIAAIRQKWGGGNAVAETGNALAAAQAGAQDKKIRDEGERIELGAQLANNLHRAGPLERAEKQMNE